MLRENIQDMIILWVKAWSVEEDFEREPKENFVYFSAAVITSRN